MDLVHHFGRFEVRPLQRQLLVDGEEAKLGARAFDVLLALIDRHGQLVSKHELLDVVWSGLVVEENNLVVQVGTLRKLLGAEVIATIPGRGYRFTAVAAGAPVADADDHGALRAVEGRLRTNLPDVLPPLIGREHDLAALEALLARHRLITITGAGGMGKTRLAEQVLDGQRAAHVHGVAWVELAGIADAALLPGTIAGALGLQLGPADPLQGLVAALKPLQMLVALDNAEHLVDAVAGLAQAVLDAAPQLRLIVTSQVPLRLPLERVYRLGALAVPDADAALEEALSCGAVALFVERAQAADRRFEARLHTLPSIIGICAQLDGVALAIELAAARVPVLGVTALAAALDERLRLLTLGRRGAPERQRTLRAALEWSLGLLSEDEAIVFRRLGVFVGGFTLEMAREVAADDDRLDPWVVVDALAALVDRSLVAADTAEAPRYRLLESARVLALERLAQADESHAVRQRHARAVSRRMAGVIELSMDGRMKVDASRQALEVDLDNARAALAWMLANGDSLGAASLAPNLAVALTFARHQERALVWEATAPCVSDTLPPAVRADWACAYSAFCLNRKPELCATWARKAITIYRPIGDARGLYRALSSLCIATIRLGERDESAAAYAEMRRIEDPAWSPRLKLYGTEAAYFYEHRRGDLDAARVALQHKQALAEAAGDAFNSLTMQVNLADLDLHAGRVDDAVRGGRELERRASKTRQLYVLDFARRNLTAALLAQGAIVEARTMARTAWPLAVSFDYKHVLADTLADMAMQERRPEAAARLCGYSDAIYAAFGSARDPNEALAIERTQRAARQQLGDAAFERLRAEGASLCDEAVLAIALGAGDDGG